MSASSLERLAHGFANPTNGVVGLVEQLLAASAEIGAQLTWRSGRCTFRLSIGSSDGIIEMPLAKSVVRAIIARIAALCNEKSPNSVLPYGGQGEIDVSSGIALRVAFVNTPEEQTLELVPIRSSEIAKRDTKTTSVTEKRR